jgi:lipoyl-dependent peroxiredoxin
MPVRVSEAEWEGNLKEGKGIMRLGSGAYEGKYSFQTRFEEEPGANPEELIGAAHAGCFSMALSGELARAGFEPKRIETRAEVHLGPVDGKNSIHRIHLTTRVEAPGIDEQTLMKKAEAAKQGCPVSRALASIEITLDASLV